MDNELKETLLKVADYHELEKQKAAEVGNMSFGIMFCVCAIAIIVQMLMAGNLSLVIGETVILVVGGLVYLYFMVKNGAWDGAMKKSMPKKDLTVSAACTGVFSLVFYLLSRRNADSIHAMGGAVCFFLVFCAVSFVFLRVLSSLSRRKSHNLKDR